MTCHPCCYMMSKVSEYESKQLPSDKVSIVDDLITIPMHSRASVLRERNLLHLLEEEMEEDAATTFAYNGQGIRIIIMIDH